MDPHASFSNSHPANFRSPYQPYPAVPLNPNGVFLGSTVSQNLSHTPMYQGFFPNHSGSQVGYQNPPSFMFRERKGRVNWRNISSLDVDELIGKGDIRMLESYLSNISFANLEKEDIESFGDVNLLKLFRLSQYGLEYLLNCQNYLASQAQTLDYQYRASEEHLGPLEEQAKRNQAEILNLKNEINQKKDLVKAYQNSLSNPIYKCHLCPKLFKSQDFLNQHFQVRHENAISKGKKTPKVEPVPAPNPNTQQETAQMIEKLMSQLKQNEDLKLSQLTSSLQDRLQEVIKSNKELTAKVAEMEKKMDVERESGSVSSPDQPFNRTMRRDNPSIDPRQSIDDIQSRQTPKKHTIVKDLGSPKQSFRAGELEDGEITDRQILKDEQKHKTQAFHAGSLNDFEEDRSSVKNPSVGTLKDVSEKEYPKIVFRAGELEDVTEEYKPMPKIAALPSQVTKGIKQTFKAGSMEDDEEEVGKQSVNKKHEEGGKNRARKQVFNAGEFEPELKEVKGLTKHFAGALEDDNDFVEARNRKRSQEDVVVMEEQEEREQDERRLRKESHGRDGIRNTEEVDEDEIREQHKNAVVKAMNLIKNKYVHPIKNEEYEKAEKQVHKDLKSKCAKILNTDYDKLKDQSTSDLAEMEKALKLHTQKDAAPLQKLHNEYQNMTNQVQQPNNKQRLDSEEGSKSKSKLANLVVDPERSSKGMKSSIDKAGAKKQQVFESQNLDSQLGSYEELKIKYAQNAKDNGTNLMKKSIQGGAVEYL